MSANYTAVNQLINGFKQRLEKSRDGVQFDSLVFIPDHAGPLSWHLSEEQKRKLRSPWNSDDNREALKHLLEFLNGLPDDALQSSRPHSPERMPLDKSSGNRGNYSARSGKWN